MKKSEAKAENVMIRIRSERTGSAEELFPDSVAGAAEYEENGDEKTEPEKTEMFAAGRFELIDGRAVISYAETELTGMEGSTTEISFALENPGLVSMFRSGAVSTSLVFEAGKRYHCLYETPMMPFDVCVHTFRVRNTLLSDGQLSLEYVIEIRGARAERCKMNLSLHRRDAEPTPHL